MAGFEPAASTSQMWRDTGLRYIPFGFAKVSFYITSAIIFENFLFPINFQNSVKIASTFIGNPTSQKYEFVWFKQALNYSVTYKISIL
jgi:hypothetical protein